MTLNGYDEGQARASGPPDELAEPDADAVPAVKPAAVKIRRRRPEPFVDRASRYMERVMRDPLPGFVVISGMLLFSMVFSWAHIQSHRAFATYSFDTGIYDQAVWALAHEGNPFMTVRGLFVHGHHVNPILYLLVPVSWLGGGATSFLVIQTLVFALGAWPVYLIARKVLARPSNPMASPTPSTPSVAAAAAMPVVAPAILTAAGVIPSSPVRVSNSARMKSGISGGILVGHTPNPADTGAAVLGCVLALAYLLSPVVQWVNQSHWHPEAFSGTALLWAWWFALARRWRAYGVAVLIALATREETALAVVMLGVVLLVEHRRSLWTDFFSNRERRRDVVPAALTVLAGTLWFVVSTKVIIPAFNDGRPPYFFKTFFGTFGGSIGGIVRTAVTDPGLVVSTVIKPDRLRYLRDFGLPTLFVFVLSPLHCLMMLPSLASNLLTDNVYAREIKYQYAAVLIGPMWIATIHGVGRVVRYRTWLKRLVLAVFVASLISNINFSPSPLSKASKDGYWSTPTERSAVQLEAVKMVPKDAGVAATYFMLTHLDQRKDVYDWPNPFKPSYWGNYDPVKPTPDPDPARVQWVVADRMTMDDEGRALLESLTAPGGRFEIYFDKSDIVVAGPVRAQQIQTQAANS